MIRRMMLMAPLMLVLTGCVGNLFYQPDRRVYQTPADKGLAYEEVTFRSADGTKLSGWFIPAIGKPHGTVIHFHGNAQNMTAHFSFVDWLPAAGFNLFTFDYRGYGKSEGVPERAAILADGKAALNYLRLRPDIDADSLLVLGQSLGGTNAIAIVGGGDNRGVRAMAIDSTFYSYRSIVRDKIGEIPVLSLLKWPLSLLVIGNNYSSGSVVDNVSPIPVVFIHGTGDNVIPYHHSVWLYEKAKEPKQLWTVNGGVHTQALAYAGSPFRRRLIEFYLRSLEGPVPVPGERQP
jgi:fermentation-respiration switch protein FrsA (DUF1100 family)